MKITGTTSYINVEIGGKTVKIEGEMIVGGFVAYKDTISHWEPPFENEVIEQEMKEKIMRRVLNETQGSHMVVTFE